MKEIALLGQNGPVFTNVLTALLEAGRDVDVFVNNPMRVMLDQSNVTINHLDTSSKADTRRQLEGFDIVVMTYETDFQDVENDDFILRTYVPTVNAAIEAGAKRIIVVGSKDSEAFYRGELNRHKDAPVETSFISTEGAYGAQVVAELGD